MAVFSLVIDTRLHFFLRSVYQIGMIDRNNIEFTSLLHCAFLSGSICLGVSAPPNPARILATSKSELGSLLRQVVTFTRVGGNDICHNKLGFCCTIHGCSGFPIEMERLWEPPFSKTEHSPYRCIYIFSRSLPY